MPRLLHRASRKVEFLNIAPSMCCLLAASCMQECMGYAIKVLCSTGLRLHLEEPLTGMLPDKSVLVLGSIKFHASLHLKLVA